jgi:N-acetylglutamate synthase-like GNAT family acetyltransferase
MLDSSCHFIELEKVKFPLVNRFYKRAYKKGIASKNETVFILKNNQGIICSAKLKSIEESLLLTGVACDPKYQHQGHTSMLIKTLLKNQDQSVYCFPYAHLEAFYLRLGFTFLTPDQAPKMVQQRFFRYQQHQNLLLMIYKQSY